MRLYVGMLYGLLYGYHRNPEGPCPSFLFTQDIDSSSHGRLRREKESMGLGLLSLAAAKACAYIAYAEKVCSDDATYDRELNPDEFCQEALMRRLEEERMVHLLERFVN